MKLKNIGIISSVIAVIGGLYALVVIMAGLNSEQKLLTAKIDLVLEGQNEIKQELVLNAEEHKLFALWEPTINYVVRYFNLK